MLRRDKDRPLNRKINFFIRLHGRYTIKIQNKEDEKKHKGPDTLKESDDRLKLVDHVIYIRHKNNRAQSEKTKLKVENDDNDGGEDEDEERSKKRKRKQMTEVT